MAIEAASQLHTRIAHAIDHAKIGSSTSQVSPGFKFAFLTPETIVDLAGELAHQKESGSSLRHPNESLAERVGKPNRQDRTGMK